MDTMAVPLVGLLVGLAAGLVLGLLLGGLAASRRRRADIAELMRERESRIATQGALDAARSDNDALRRSQGEAAALTDLLAPVREGLERLRSASETARVERTKADAVLTSQVAAIAERYTSLETSTRQLSEALARGQTRGQWGEMQLEGLLGHAGLLEGVHYVRQSTRTDVDGSRRPDLAVLLPGGDEVIVDAKFPFDAYWSSFDAPDAAAREAMLRKHAADIEARARELAGRRYAGPGDGVDFVVMFLPLESLLSSALEVDGLLLERTFARRVVLATPTTMLALLRTIALTHQRHHMAENSEEVRAASAEMLARLATLADHLHGIRRGLEQAVKGYNAFVGSFDSQAMRQAHRLAELGVGGDAARLVTPDSVDDDLRVSDPVVLRTVSGGRTPADGREPAA